MCVFVCGFFYVSCVRVFVVLCLFAVGLAMMENKKMFCMFVGGTQGM